MLKLRRIVSQKDTPVKLDAELFAQRILGNYSLIKMHISAEPLIHALLVPYGRDGIENEPSSYLVQNIQIRQQACLDVVNQLTNRLRAVEQGRQNYQDGVFIHSVLKKLGIHNQQEFLKLLVETSGVGVQKRELTRLCGSTRQIFTALKSALEKKRPRRWRKRRAGDKGKEEKGRYYLHHSVFERMHILESYRNWQELRFQAQEGIKRPGPDFAEIMENLEFTDSLFVSMLNGNVFGLKEAEVFQTFNPYERWNLHMDSFTKEKVRSALVSAVLLNLVRETSIYASGLPGSLPGADRLFWIDIREAVGKCSQITADRFLYYHRSLLKADMENQKELLTVMQDGFAREVRILYSIRDMAGRREQEDETKELKKTQAVITDILKERQEVFQEELLGQTERMLHAVTQIEEDIRRYVYYTEVHYVTGRHWDSVEEAELVHVRREGSPKERKAAAPPSMQERGTMHQSVALQDGNYTDRKNIRLDLAVQSKKEVSRLVKDNIQEQMNVLTDKVYSRLEHRLMNEKKRRGM